ncbi:MAG: NAD(P)-dependent alcohol dehydrogenase [Alphaproteobacteria bacterium]
MISGFACHNPKEALKPLAYEPGPLGDDEVEVKVTHCGICHSDIHLIDNDWGISSYPFIPGHEIVGTISAKGKNVREREIGQRVGIGWQRASCGACDMCRAGLENLCAKSAATCVGHHGGFAEAARADWRFAIPLPDRLASGAAAPLLCGGVTVYSPFRTHNVGQGMNVAVVGIGGLGHMALQFASARGCRVTALSTSKNKEAEAKSFGAEKFLLSNDMAAMRDAADTMDFILVTASGDVDISALMNLLKTRGKLCIVGAIPTPLSVHAFTLIGGEKSIVGSAIGSPAAIKEMLEVAAAKNIAAKIETAPMPSVNAALDKVRANAVRYRMVLEN